MKNQHYSFWAILFFSSILVAMSFGSREERPDEEIVICAMDVKECSDGSFVSRDPKNDCQFFDCPEGD